MIELIASLLVLIGSIFIFIASVGLLRMPDLFVRMHATTKAGTLGVALILLGVSVHYHQFSLTLEALLTLFFIFVTTPVAYHLIGRAAYLSGVHLAPETTVNELKAHNHNDQSFSSKEAGSSGR